MAAEVQIVVRFERPPDEEKARAMFEELFQDNDANVIEWVEDDV